MRALIVLCALLAACGGIDTGPCENASSAGAGSMSPALFGCALEVGAMNSGSADAICNVRQAVYVYCGAPRTPPQPACAKTDNATPLGAIWCCDPTLLP